LRVPTGQHPAQRDRLGHGKDRRMGVGLVRNAERIEAREQRFGAGGHGPTMKRHGAATQALAHPHPLHDMETPGCGRSSGVEHDLAKVGVEGSNPFARSSARTEIKTALAFFSEAAAYVATSRAVVPDDSIVFERKQDSLRTQAHQWSPARASSCPARNDASIVEPSKSAQPERQWFRKILMASTAD